MRLKGYKCLHFDPCVYTPYTNTYAHEVELCGSSLFSTLYLTHTEPNICKSVPLLIDESKSQSLLLYIGKLYNNRL